MVTGPGMAVLSPMVVSGLPCPGESVILAPDPGVSASGVLVISCVLLRSWQADAAISTQMLIPIKSFFITYGLCLGVTEPPLPVPLPAGMVSSFGVFSVSLLGLPKPVVSVGLTPAPVSDGDILPESALFAAPCPLQAVNASIAHMPVAKINFFIDIAYID